MTVAGPLVVSTVVGLIVRFVSCGGVVSLCDDVVVVFVKVVVVVVVGAAVVALGGDVVVVVVVVTQVPLESHVPPEPQLVPVFGVAVQEDVPLHVRVVH